MATILVTGSTGHLGRQTLQFLLETHPENQLIALARDPAKISALDLPGVEVRQGDYTDYISLVQAFAGVDTLFMVAAVSFTDRETQHKNVISAAKEAGVKRIVYTGLQRPDGSTFAITETTQTEVVTEEFLKASGVTYTVLRNSLYLDALLFMIGQDACEEGVRLPAGTGKAAMVSRHDLAEANARVLTETGHENKTYTLGASEAFSFADIAAALSDICGKPIPYVDTPVQEYVYAKVKLGFPVPVALFLAEWGQAVASGEFSEVTKDLEQLLGRKPTPYKTDLAKLYAASV
jgi:NAD(P)H dehydrogenase (quinone)